MKWYSIKCQHFSNPRATIKEKSLQWLPPKKKWLPLTLVQGFGLAQGQRKTWYRSRPIFQGQKTEAVHSHIAATPKAQTLPHRMLIVSNLESKGQARPARHRTAKSCTSAWSKVTQWGPRTSSETYWNNDIKMHQMYPVIINDPIAFRYPYRSLKNIQYKSISSNHRNTNPIASFFRSPRGWKGRYDTGTATDPVPPVLPKQTARFAAPPGALPQSLGANFARADDARLSHALVAG